MKINVTYDGSTLATAPSDFYTVVDYVVSLFDTIFSNPATVNIEVGYGDFPLDGSIVTGLGESDQSNVVFTDYANVRSILVAENAPGSNTLPPTSPLSGRLVLGTAQEKALGLIAASDSLDGWVGVASNATLQADGQAWSFSTTATPGANQFYLVGTLEHEFSEVMGRVSYLDKAGEYGIADLYRYASPGVRQTGFRGPAYFSTDSGTTNLDNWNNSRFVGDLGDWAPTNTGGANFTFAGDDAFLAVEPPGKLDGLTATDQTLMAALGWNATPPSLDRFQFFVPNQTVNLVRITDGTTPPAAVSGDFNLALVTHAAGTSYSLPSGYQGLAFEPGSSGNVLMVPAGNLMIVDKGTNGTIALGAAQQTVIGGFGDTIAGGFGGSVIMGSAGAEQIIAGSGPTTVFGAAGDKISTGSGPLLAIINHSAGGAGVIIADSGSAGSDTVTGFSQISGDRIAFANQTTATIDNVVAAAQTSNGNTVITLPDGTTMTLVGITKIDSTFFV